MDQQTPENRTRRQMQSGVGLATGIALGVGFHNLALGIAFGMAIGCAFDGGIAYRNRRRQ